MQPQYPPQYPPASPEQQPQYPPQPPQAPPVAQYPPQYGQPQAAPVAQYPPQYGQPQAAPAPQYPPQYGQAQYPSQYGQQYAPPPPQAPTVKGSLDDFYNQPSTGGGKALSFETPGTTYIGIVSRPIGDGDIQQQTDAQGRPSHFKDGRPKFVMKVPLQMQPHPLYPDGIAQWYVKGADRDELVRAMAEVGAPEGPPEAGAIISVTFTGTRPSGPGMNPTKLKQVRYQRPSGAAPVAVAPPVAHVPAVPGVNGYANGAPVPAPPAPMPAPAPAPPMPAPMPVPAPPAPPMPAPAPAPPMPAPAPAPPMPAPAPPPMPTAVAPPLVELNPGQHELLAKLTGHTAPAAPAPVTA